MMEVDFSCVESCDSTDLCVLVAREVAALVALARTRDSWIWVDDCTITCDGMSSIVLELGC